MSERFIDVCARLVRLVEARGTDEKEAESLSLDLARLVDLAAMAMRIAEHAEDKLIVIGQGRKAAVTEAREDLKLLVKMRRFVAALDREEPDGGEEMPLDYETAAEAAGQRALAYLAGLDKGQCADQVDAASGFGKLLVDLVPRSADEETLGAIGGLGLVLGGYLWWAAASRRDGRLPPTVEQLVAAGVPGFSLDRGEGTA